MGRIERISCSILILERAYNAIRDPSNSLTKERWVAGRDILFLFGEALNYVCAIYSEGLKDCTKGEEGEGWVCHGIDALFERYCMRRIALRFILM